MRGECKKRKNNNFTVKRLNETMLVWVEPDSSGEVNGDCHCEQQEVSFKTNGRCCLLCCSARFGLNPALKTLWFEAARPQFPRSDSEPAFLKDLVVDATLKLCTMKSSGMGPHLSLGWNVFTFFGPTLHTRIRKKKNKSFRKK